ncbi:PAAR-like protein [Chryseobacterium phocaeense]|uniref:PAAR-like protein n=1 Tax=Chryseobacterium phocaeense TaxID=1816690 RepID=UPI0009B97F1C|nr:PAAR-like protein [Chryseobacterium phocaeense]
MENPNTSAHDDKLSEKRAEKEKKSSEDSPAEKREMVLHGAELKCPYAQGPGELKVTSNEINLQDKIFATKGDGNNMVNLQFKGTCGHPKWPARNMSPPPCMSVIKLSPWQNLGTSVIQEQTALVKESFINCDPEFNTASPSAIPQAASIKSEIQTDDAPKILDAYFVKWTSEKGTPVEKEEEVYSKQKGKKVTVKKKVETTKIATEKISERGLSYQVALIVETEGLSGKKIKVKVKSGKTKVLTDVDADLGLIDLTDVEKVTDASKYAGIKAKTEFEVAVDNFANDPTIENSAEFKNKAVVRLMLNQRADDLSFDLAKLIAASTDKEASVYIEVTSDEPKIEYLGQEGKNSLKNTFLNGGQYFKIKYFEQPWIVKAREEQELGVSESTHCKKIVDEYHAINRQNKPTACANTDNSSWCASFVGWCLNKSGYSAQLDPGAYSYGHENTRYRAGYKKNPTDKKGLAKEEFDDPVWGKLIAGNQPLLGSICVLLNKHHVSMAVGKSSDGKTIYYLGGNQGNKVCVGTFGQRTSSIYPTEYTKKTEDDELPIYYTKNEKLSY